MARLEPLLQPSAAENRPGGVIGSWRLTGEIAPFIPFLYLGQWLHVGKEATFGLGGYRLELHL
ncbi:MAG: CRISPR system precrRNA processing endoribonuclease RAMP protein Cas6 [Zoogloea sp.]|nr:CRISPR system precrRNA processing endoribonuclease RAMP protein Cas6 [Zoogloea sp.]